MNRLNMKKLILSVILVFFAYSSASAQEYKLSLIKRFFSMGTASINGTYYPFGSAITKLFNAKLENAVSIAEPTKGSVANVEFLRGKQIELALIQSDVAFQALHGVNQFSNRSFKDLKIMASLYSEVIQIVARKDSGINTIHDLKGKKIAVGNEGSGSAVSSDIIFNSIGFTKADYIPVYHRFTKATEQLKDGYIDALFYTGGVPADGITRLASKVDITLVQIPAEIRDQMVEDYPYLTKEDIAAKSYVHQDQKVSTIGLRALLCASKEVSPEYVEKMLELLFDNLDYLASLHPVASLIKLKDSTKGIYQESLHDGAKKFFNKKGIIKVKPMVAPPSPATTETN